MKILALDLGSKMGFSLREKNIVTYGLQKFIFQEGESDGIRFLKFRNWLKTFGDLDYVFFEEVKFIQSSSKAAKVYHSFRSNLLTYCAENNIEHMGVPVQTIKIFGTGKGNADKDLMVKHARILGCNSFDDNVADSYILLNYAVNFLRI